MVLIIYGASANLQGDCSTSEPCHLSPTAAVSRTTSTGATDSGITPRTITGDTDVGKWTTTADQTDDIRDNEINLKIGRDCEEGERKNIITKMTEQEIKEEEGRRRRRNSNSIRDELKKVNEHKRCSWL
ncbi:hypothetical protein Hamer_G023266, partial [Homarus americanus]